MLNGLDLFSGIGGLTLALQDWIKPIAYCENDRYAQAILLSRMSERKIAFAPIWDDVRTLSAQCFDNRIPIQIIYGGFPCQDISSAGNGKGLDGERSGLFYEVVRLAREIRPRFIFLENVPIIRTRGGERVCKELAACGYDSRWHTLSAYDVGAPQKRERWFLLAHSNNSDGYKSREIPRENEKKNLSKISRQNKADKPSDAAWWKTEPRLDRVANGLPYQMDRIRGLANAVVPQQAKEAFKRLMGL